MLLKGILANSFFFVLCDVKLLVLALSHDEVTILTRKSIPSLITLKFLLNIHDIITMITRPHSNPVYDVTHRRSSFVTVAAW